MSDELRVMWNITGRAAHSNQQLKQHKSLDIANNIGSWDAWSKVSFRGQGGLKHFDPLGNSIIKIHIDVDDKVHEQWEYAYVMRLESEW